MNDVVAVRFALALKRLVDAYDVMASADDNASEAFQREVPLEREVEDTIAARDAASDDLRDALNAANDLLGEFS